MPEAFLNALPYILGGIGYTVLITLVALAVGFIIGAPIAMLRTYGGRVARFLGMSYVVVLRGIPSLVVLFLAYYVLAAAIDLPPFLAGCVALGVCSSAYQAEIFRGAIQGVGQGQMMAARALGMTRRQAILYIVLPQALRNAIPGWSNEAAVVVKDSSLVYAVGLAELMRRAQQVNGTLHEPFLIFFTTGVLYFLLTFTTNRLLGWAERALRLPEMEAV
ncbi:MAG TPA: amino acid ABC transporter permease [Chloroflexi bacterium]|nr:amino acid ABC transporter permease [Chloroflexota bacterium]